MKKLSLFLLCLMLLFTNVKAYNKYYLNVRTYI